MHLFGSDDNVSCLLAPFNGDDDAALIFDARLVVPPERRGWKDLRLVWGDIAHTHKIIVLCKDKSIAERVQVIAEMTKDRMEHRKQLADENGLILFVAKVGETYAGVFY